MVASFRLLIALLILAAGYSPLMAEESGWNVLYPKSYDGYFSLAVNSGNKPPGHLEIRSKEASNRQILLAHSASSSVTGSGKPYTVTLEVKMDSVDPVGEPFVVTFSSQAKGGSQGPTSSIWYLTVKDNRWWAVGANEGGDGAYWQKLPIKAEAGVAYTFNIRVSPASGTYRAEVSNGTDRAESPEIRSAVKEASSGVEKELLVRIGTTAEARFTCSLSALEIRPE